MPCDSVSFSASKPVEKSKEERVKDLEERKIPSASAKEILDFSQENYDKCLTLIDKGLSRQDTVQIIKSNDDKYQRITNLLDKNCPANFAMSIVSNSYYEKGEKLLLDYPEFLDTIDSSYNLEYEDLQNYSGFRIVAKKVINNEEEKVVKKVIIDNKGNLSKNTTYTAGNLIQSFEHGKDKSTMIIATKSEPKYDLHDVLLRQIDIINDENGQPHHIIATKRSNKLEGAFEITKYVLADYPEDLDMVGLFMNLALDEKIEELGLKPGEKLSETYKNPDGSVTYEENYTYDGRKISKKYTEYVDSEYDVEKMKYSYHIKNEDGSDLFKMDRSWKRNEDGTTSTIINGKEYVADFNDENQIVRVTKPDGATETIFIGAKCTGKSKEDFWEFAKTLPADVLMPIKYLREIEVTENHSGLYLDCYYLDIVPNASTMAHEMGHGIDWYGRNIDDVGRINGNRELLKIYNKEIEKFNKENPMASQDIIEYFSQTGGSRSTGLSEVVADVLTLMTSYGHSDETLAARINYLTRYFPETVAKTAELYGYNQVQ